MIAEGYAANTLKATIKERRGIAADAEALGDAYYCPDCFQFTELNEQDLETGFVPPCGHCQEANLVHVKDGVPAVLTKLLYINEHYVLGCRKAN